MEESYVSPHRPSLFFFILLVLSILVAPSLQSSATKSSGSGISFDSARNRIDKERDSGKESLFRRKSVKQAERGSSRLQRLYNLTQQQAQERLRSKASALNRGYSDRRHDPQSSILSTHMPLQKESTVENILTPIERSVKLILTKAELHRISQEVHEYDMAKRKQNSLTNRLSKKMPLSVHNGIEVHRKNDPRYKFAISLLESNPEFFSQLLQEDVDTGELTENAVITADRIRKRYMAYFGLRGGSLSLDESNSGFKKGKNNTKKVKKKKKKKKKKLKVKVAPSQKAKKTKIAVSKGTKREIILPFQDMSDIQFQIVTTAVYLFGQKLIKKVDFKQKSNLKLGRFVFATYCLLAHLMIRYIRTEIEAANDSTLITLPNPLSALTAVNPMVVLSYFAAMIPGMGSKTQTIKDFDTLKVNEMSQGLMFEILPAVFMHLVKKKGAPLFLVPLMGILNKMRAPLVRIHVLGQTIKRPFKSGIEEMISTLTKQAIPVTEEPIENSDQRNTQRDEHVRRGNGGGEEDKDSNEIDLDKPVIKKTPDSNDFEVSLQDMAEDFSKELEKALESMLGSNNPLSGMPTASRTADDDVIYGHQNEDAMRSEDDEDEMEKEEKDDDHDDEMEEEEEEQEQEEQEEQEEQQEQQEQQQEEEQQQEQEQREEEEEEEEGQGGEEEAIDDEEDEEGGGESENDGEDCEEKEGEEKDEE